MEQHLPWHPSGSDALPQPIGEGKPVDYWRAHINTVLSAAGDPNAASIRPSPRPIIPVGPLRWRPTISSRRSNGSKRLRRSLLPPAMPLPDHHSKPSWDGAPVTRQPSLVPATSVHLQKLDKAVGRSSRRCGMLGGFSQCSALERGRARIRISIPHPSRGRVLCTRCGHVMSTIADGTESTGSPVMRCARCVGLTKLSW